MKNTIFNISLALVSTFTLMSPKSVLTADYRCVVNINNQPITMPYPIIISIVEDGQKVRYYGEYRAGSISMDSAFSHHISSSNSDSCELAYVMTLIHIEKKNLCAKECRGAIDLWWIGSCFSPVILPLKSNQAA